MKKLYSVATAFLLATMYISAQKSVPYTHSFDNTDCLNEWTTISNPESYAYKYVVGHKNCSRNGVLSRQIYSAGGGKKDSWLISPAISLTAGTTYTVKYTLATSNETKSYIGIRYGQEPKIDALTESANFDNYMYFAPSANGGFDYTLVSVWGYGFTQSGYAQTFEGTIKPSKSGDYYIALTDQTEASLSSESLIFDISVTAAASGNMPADPTDFSAVPDKFGDLSVKLTAATPYLDASGKDLKSLTALEFLRDGTVIKTISNPSMGRRYSYTDTDAKNGYNTYSVRAINEAGSSNMVETKVKVGLEIPDVPKDVMAGQISAGSAKVSWVKPESDIFGNLILNSELISTKIVVKDGNSIVKTYENLQGTEATLDFDPDMESKYYTGEVYAVTNGGVSRPIAITFTIGKISELPYSENFAGGAPQNFLYVNDTKYSGDNWEYLIPESGEKSGAARFTAGYINGSAKLCSNLIALPANSKPELTLQYYAESKGRSNTLTVLIFADGKWTETNNYTVSEDTWTDAAIDLSNYAGKNIQYALKGTKNSNSNFMVTDIAIKDKNQSGISNIISDETSGEPVYYDLMGRRIANPTAGAIYIRVVNGKAQRILIR